MSSSLEEIEQSISFADELKFEHRNVLDHSNEHSIIHVEFKYLTSDWDLIYSTYKIRLILLCRVAPNYHAETFIMSYLAQLNNNNCIVIQQIIVDAFQSNQQESTSRMVKSLIDHGYLMSVSNDQTCLRLPLNCIGKHIKGYISGVYIAEYIPSYSNYNHSYHDEKSAITAGLKLQAGGITYEGGEYSLRNNSQFYRSPFKDAKSKALNHELENIILDWVFVSAFYNLDKLQDFNQSEARSSKYYDDRFSVFEFNIPLVFFCDPEQEEYYITICKQMNRTAYTKIIPIPFSELYFAPYVNQIKTNRLGNIHYTNNRNNPAYSALTLSKMWMMDLVSKDETFMGNMICWIDYSYPWRDIKYFRHELQIINHSSENNYDNTKYHLALIDWAPNTSSYKRKNFYRSVKCTFAGGFHYGHRKVIPHIWELMKVETIKTLNKGLGHAEEQIFFHTYIRHRQYFSYYISDYGQQVYNTTKMTILPKPTINLLLTNLHQCNELEMAHHLYQLIMTAVKNKYFVLSQVQENVLQKIMMSINRLSYASN